MFACIHVCMPHLVPVFVLLQSMEEKVKVQADEAAELTKQLEATKAAKAKAEEAVRQPL